MYLYRETGGEREREREREREKERERERERERDFFNLTVHTYTDFSRLVNGHIACLVALTTSGHAS